MTKTDVTLLPARSLRDFLDCIRAASLNGEWIAVKYHPNGDWSVGSDAINASLRTPVATPDGLVERKHFTADEMEAAGCAPWQGKQPIEEFVHYRAGKPWVPLDAAIAQLQFWQRRDYEHAALSHRDAWYDMRDARDSLATQLAERDESIARLIDAMNALLRAPKGVVPDIAQPFYDAQIGSFTAVRACQALGAL